jgi:DNA polymerase III epsilon subunit-like protein
LHFSRLPAANYVNALDALAALTQAAARLEGFYQVALPSLGSAYASYLGQTDRLIDEPTVVILEDALRDIDRMRSEGARLLDEFPTLREGASSAAGELRRSFTEATDIVDIRRESQSA